MLFLKDVLVENYEQYIRDYQVWNYGISPYTNKPWQFIGKDFHNIKHYKDDLNNAISIKTNIDIICKK